MHKKLLLNRWSKIALYDVLGSLLGGSMPEATMKDGHVVQVDIDHLEEFMALHGDDVIKEKGTGEPVPDLNKFPFNLSGTKSLS